MSNTTTVIVCNEKEFVKNGFNYLEQWLKSSPKHVYIVRDVSCYIKGSTANVLHNPFSYSVFW